MQPPFCQQFTGIQSTVSTHTKTDNKVSAFAFAVSAASQRNYIKCALAGLLKGQLLANVRC